MIDTDKLKTYVAGWKAVNDVLNAVVQELRSPSGKFESGAMMLLVKQLQTEIAASNDLAIKIAPSQVYEVEMSKLPPPQNALHNQGIPDSLGKKE